MLKTGLVGCALKSQSLFHQVCVRSRPVRRTVLPYQVAIPFSSGLCSFLLLGRPCPVCLSSQSLFHQVCVRSSCRRYIWLLSRLSQSLFHQVCVRSRAGRRGCSPAWQASQSLFHQVCVRSSTVPRGSLGWPSRNPFFIRSVFVRREVQ